MLRPRPLHENFRSMTFLSVMFVTLFSTASLASSFDRLSSLIKIQPEYLEVRSQIALSDWEIASIRADGMPTLAFKSSGKYPITSNGNRNSRSNSEDSFIDGTFTVTLPFLDFGARSSRVKAEEFKKKARVLGLQLKEEEMLFDLLDIGILVKKNRQFRDAILEDIDEIQKRQEIEKLRYKGGTGTLTSIRELDLMILELQTQSKLRSLDLEIAERTFADRYAAKIDDYLADILTTTNAPLLEPDLDKKLARLKKFDLDKQEIDKKITATQLNQYPKIDFTISAAFYNVPKRFMAEREIYGGLGLSFPLFDAGSADSEIKSLEVQRAISDSRQRKENSAIKIKVAEAYTLLEKNMGQLADNEQITKTLEAKLMESEIKSKSISANTHEAAKIIKEIRQIKRSSDDTTWDNKSIRLRLAFLNETLISSLQPGQIASK